MRIQQSPNADRSTRESNLFIRVNSRVFVVHESSFF
jgi:hypothetical protein